MLDSHAVYYRYQMQIHHDAPSKPNEQQFHRFLCDSPLLVRKFWQNFWRSIGWALTKTTPSSNAFWKPPQLFTNGTKCKFMEIHQRIVVKKSLKTFLLSLQIWYKWKIQSKNARFWDSLKRLFYRFIRAAILSRDYEIDVQVTNVIIISDFDWQRLWWSTLKAYLMLWNPFSQNNAKLFQYFPHPPPFSYSPRPRPDRKLLLQHGGFFLPFRKFWVFCDNCKIIDLSFCRWKSTHQRIIQAMDLFINNIYLMGNWLVLVCWIYCHTVFLRNIFFMILITNFYRLERTVLCGKNL